MKHLSWKYRRRRTRAQQREFCAAQAARVEKRWAKARAAAAAEPLRTDRVVELTVRDSHRPGTTLRLESRETAAGFRRWAMAEAGRQIGPRRMGRHAIAKLIAQWLE